MTQLFMGVKPGVGPVVKVLKYNGDDALTLANNAYDRYFFNSENQQLSYVFGNFSLAFSYSSFPSTGVYNFGNYTIYCENSASIKRPYKIGKINGIYPSRPFLPLPEVRAKQSNGRFLGGLRQLSLWIDETFSEVGEVSSYQFPTCLMRVTALFAPAPINAFNWTGYCLNNMGVVPGDWIALAQRGVAGGTGFTMNAYENITASTPESRYIFNYWNLPADSSAMPTYSMVPDLETLRMDEDEFVLTRPGYSVGGSAGRNQRIIDSDTSPALCVAAGVTPSIAPGSSYVITVSIPGITLSDTAVVDLMVKETGDYQFVPCHVPAGYVHDSAFNVSYLISGNNVIIYNEGTGAVTVTYVVFNSSETAPSTGGSLIMFRGNDGTQDFIQIKKPGTSDPASRPGDILLDTRLPTIHILSEGWLPLSSFTDSAENVNGLGKVAKQVNFNGNGMIPFVKFCTVFPNHILAPMCSLYYTYGSGADWGPPSNQSALCRLQSDNAKFWLNPGNWSRLTGGVSSGVSQVFDGPDPLGIRYYILGIPT